MYVNPDEIPNGIKKFVCWIDIMGTRSRMQRSVKTAGVGILELHAAIIETVKSRFNNFSNKIRVYPMMDGAYIVAEEWKDMTSFLQLVFEQQVKDFLMENQFKGSEWSKEDAEKARNEKRSLLRASISYGKVIEGHTIPRPACAQLANSVNEKFEIKDVKETDTQYKYRDTLLFGIPMVKAFSNERKAPPFGIYLDEFARTSAEIPYIWWKWFDTKKKTEDQKKLIKAVNNYFNYSKQHIYESDYKKDRIAEHEQMFHEYFDCFEKSEK